MRPFLILLILFSGWRAGAADYDLGADLEINSSAELSTDVESEDLFANLMAARAVGPMASGVHTGNAVLPSSTERWNRFSNALNTRKRADYVMGLSYIISGSLAIVGGQIGATYATDPIEKGVYTLFQTIGIASVGYGAYTWKIGSDERVVYESIANAKGLDDAARLAMLSSYRQQSKERLKNERVIKAITHGMIAAFNFYTASQQTSDPVKSGLYFIGGVNLLASISYAF